MTKLLPTIFLSALTASAVADVPNIFTANTPAKASEVNANFSDFDSRLTTVSTSITSLETKIDESTSDSSGNTSSGSSGSITAKVNGVDRQVISNQLGGYSIELPSGLSVSVDHDGYPPKTFLYYSGADCTGDAYIIMHQIDVSDREAGHVYPNPKLNTKLSMQYDGTNIYYSLNNTITKLNYKSVDYLMPSMGCYPTRGTVAASKVLPNDVSITGVESFPLIITGVGTDLEIISEVNTPDVIYGSYTVYASSGRIGTTTAHPSGSSDYISVHLDGDYADKDIYLYKDGTYFGFDAASSGNLIYLSSDCSGNAYVNVLSYGDTRWWDTSKITNQVVENNGQYYDLSSQVYQTDKSSGSYRYYYDGSCKTAPNQFNTENGYKLATLTTTPNIPIFSPPISIGSYSEPTPISTLPEVF